MRYESAEDVKLRLHRSIVGLKGQPVHVDEVLSRTMVQVSYILTGDTERVEVKDLDLSPRSLPLGYVSVDDRVFLTSRKPCRRYKQGLTMENFHVKEVLTKPAGRIARPRPDLSPTNRAVARTMVGQFCDVGSAFQLVRTGTSRIVPFNREWAVADSDGELCVLYRGETVGYVTASSVKLLPERAYLKESLELCLI